VPAALALLAASCAADHPSPNEQRAIAIYSAVIRAALAHPATTTPAAIPTVFVIGADPRVPITLEEQAGIVQTLHDAATIRFVDKRSEAIDSSDPLQAVHENAVLLTLGTIPSGVHEVTVEVQRYEHVGAATTYVTPDLTTALAPSRCRRPAHRAREGSEPGTRVQVASCIAQMVSPAGLACLVLGRCRPGEERHSA
jgi:hypothetical protein